VIAGGTALTDATAFGKWRSARRLIDRGARSTLFESAVMGLLDRVAADVEADPPPDVTTLSFAFWGACHGGQRAAAEYLLDRSADIDWTAPRDGLTPLDAARRSEMPAVVEWLIDRGAAPSAT
jgi:ankyrin repeat protein